MKPSYSEVQSLTIPLSLIKPLKTEAVTEGSIFAMSNSNCARALRSTHSSTKSVLTAATFATGLVQAYLSLRVFSFSLFFCFFNSTSFSESLSLFFYFFDFLGWKSQMCLPVQSLAVEPSEIQVKRSCPQVLFVAARAFVASLLLIFVA